MENEWLRPKALVNLIFEYRPDLSQSLVSDLRTNLAHGLIQARAKVAIVEVFRSFDQVRAGADPKKETFRDWEVPARVWVGSLENSHLALPGLDRFTSAAPGMGYDAIKLIGLSFRRSDVLDAFEIDPTVPPTRKKAPSGARVEPANGSGRGRGPSKADWSNFAAALAVVAARDEDDLAEAGRSVASIYERIGEVLQDRLGAEAKYLSLDSVQDAIAMAQEWVARGMPTK